MTSHPTEMGKTSSLSIPYGPWPVGQMIDYTGSDQAEFSDFTFVSREGTTFYYHRHLLVESGSDFFKGMIRSQMKEAVEKTVRLDLSNATMNYLLNFMANRLYWTGLYPDEVPICEELIELSPVLYYYQLFETVIDHVIECAVPLHSSVVGKLDQEFLGKIVERCARSRTINIRLYYQILWFWEPTTTQFLAFASELVKGKKYIRLRMLATPEEELSKASFLQIERIKYCATNWGLGIKPTIKKLTQCYQSAEQMVLAEAEINQRVISNLETLLGKDKSDRFRRWLFYTGSGISGSFVLNAILQQNWEVKDLDIMCNNLHIPPPDLGLIFSRNYQVLEGHGSSGDHHHKCRYSGVQIDIDLFDSSSSFYSFLILAWDMVGCANYFDGQDTYLMSEDTLKGWSRCWHLPSGERCSKYIQRGFRLFYEDYEMNAEGELTPTAFPAELQPLPSLTTDV